MVKLLHSVAIQEQAVSADGIADYDLAVNPLSVVLVALRPLNETSTLGNYARYLTICAALNRVSINFRGQSVFSMRGEDAAVLAMLRHNVNPPEANPDDTDDERRCIVLPILLGRFPYDPASCFPASRRGELQLEIDWDIADTGYDGMRFSVETVELLGATPKEFERKIAVNQTNAATGDNDIDLPVGNVVRGVVGWGTTDFTGATPAPSFGRMSLLLDNQQVGYAGTDVEVAMALHSLLGRQVSRHDAHTHRTDATSASTTEESGGPLNEGATGNYFYLEMDPNGDDSLAIDTAGASRFVLRADVETADAVRVIPIEKISVGGK